MATPFDPQEEPERIRSSYVTRKQAIIFLLGVVVFGLLLTPVFKTLMEDRNKYVCRNNMGQISKAMQTYAELNNGRFPPTHITGHEWGPAMFKARDGDKIREAVFSWLSTIAGYMKDGSIVNCPSAPADELCPTQGPKSELLHAAYGMFGSMASAAPSNLENASTSVLFAETANMGASDTYNPLPFKDKDGKQLPDGFLIGYDSSNFDPIDQYNQLEKAKFVTRLAFPGTKNGKFEEKGPGRHGNTINFVYADGHIKSYGPAAAAVLFKAADNPWPLR
jgi:prepilin-type processing-associated H-X9-DG protein